MWHDIFYTLAGINLVVLVIVLVGYWTYADYITNINKHYKVIYCIVEGVTIAVGLEVGLLNWGFENFHAGLHVFSLTVGVATFISMILLAIALVLYGFFASRKYFGKKRNKV